ncbi:MAG TPA: Nramp family divalent metal transporter, partial [Thermosynergistes sp.]|nr:Nramp family divalent metal transporter [Thermosynergistes sp.]
MQRPVEDLYVFSESEVKEPPEGIIGALKYLGPGLILTASIVGSGELIATTTLGATAGFVTLWVIIVSCLVKVTLQLEFGKHAINTGESTMLAMNKLPGPKIGKANWTVWFWIIVMLLKMMQLGGIVGGVALALNIAFPAVSPPVWTWVTAFSVALLIWRGGYRFIERACVFMIVCFVFFTIACVFFLQFTPYHISWADIAQGLTFKLPSYAVGVAIAAFGITGVGGDEIMQYPYWCLEKGYARFVGAKDDSADWVRRARGWIKVMYIDSLFSMVIYTIATVAFYLLGAAVLHGRGTIPQGYDAMRTLATMYTESVGPWAMWVYLIGAIVVLYSTAF